MLTEERKNVCVLANDARLIEAGPGAFGAHAARLAGLSRAEQERVAQAAVRVARGAFEKSTNATRNELRLQLAVANLPDAMEVLMEAENANGAATPDLFDIAAENLVQPGKGESLIRWQSQPGLCRLVITKTPRARNLTPQPESSCRE